MSQMSEFARSPSPRGRACRMWYKTHLSYGVSSWLFEIFVLDLQSKKIKKGKTMSDYLDYLDEIYEELVDEFGHEIEANCEHNHK